MRRDTHSRAATRPWYRAVIDIALYFYKLDQGRVAARLIAVMFCICLLGLTGCESTNLSQGSRAEVRAGKPLMLPSYPMLVEKYNRNMSPITQVWSRCGVEMTWVDEGEKHWEKADDCVLSVVLPHKVAFTLGSPVKTLGWLGCDDTRYWFFDLRDEVTLYVGKHALAAEHLDRFPLPIVPGDLVRLLGITPLPEPAIDTDAMVEWLDGQYLIEPPGLPMRMLLDPQTALPTRIDLLDQQGHSRLIAKLSRYETLALTGVAPGGYPRMATRIEVSTPDATGKMVLFLRSPDDGREFDRIKQRAFDLDTLKKAYKPDEIVDLDQ